MPYALPSGAWVHVRRSGTGRDFFLGVGDRQGTLKDMAKDPTEMRIDDVILRYIATSRK